MPELSKDVELRSDTETPEQGFSVTKKTKRPLPIITLYVCVVLACSCERSSSILQIKQLLLVINIRPIDFLTLQI